MRYRVEPPHRHGNPARTAILLVNLGTPDAPTPPAVRRFLKQFLSDPRVVEIPRLVWWLVLHLLILPLRARQSAAKYAQIWSEQGSPLLVHTERLASQLRGRFGALRQDYQVAVAMRYGKPDVAAMLDELHAAGTTRLLVFPLYPQYAASTTASAMDAVMDWCAQIRCLPELRMVRSYHDHPAYIAALVQSIGEYWASHGRLFWGTDAAKERQARLLISFHGVPERSLRLGDPYHCQCQKTARLMTEALGLDPGQVVLCFQSRFGRARWLGPETAATLKRLAREGVTHVDVICPGFAVDCLETLEEIALLGKSTFLAAGGQSLRYIPCLNDSAQWVARFAEICNAHLQGWESLPSGDDRDEQRARALALGATD